MVLQRVEGSSKPGNLHRFLLHYLHLANHHLCDWASFTSCLHYRALNAGFYYFLYNERPWDSFLFMGIGRSQPKWKEIQEKIFYILEQLQYYNGPFLHDWTSDQNHWLYHLWWTLWNIHSQLGWKNTLGYSLHIRNHKNHKNWNCFKIFWTNNSEHQCYDEGCYDVSDNILRNHAGILLWGLLHVQLSSKPRKQKLSRRLQYTWCIYLFLLGSITGMFCY